MRSERRVSFEQKYGFSPRLSGAVDYLTDGQLENLAHELGLYWNIVSPNYGLAWKMRPWLARLRGRRQPARFLLVIGEKGRIRIAG
jgi:hypothetical protein